MKTDLLEGITWYKQSSVRVRRAGLEVHVDPFGVSDDGPADYVLLTHPHYDNFSEDDVDRVRGPGTKLIAPASMKKQLEEADHLMRPGDLLHLDGLDVLAVPAYNVDKKFHPYEQEWLGYVFTIGGVTYYHAGDTDLLDSMGEIHCDVAFLPCGGHYTMGPEDAARAGERCGARIVVPIHWGGAVGTRDDAERVAELLPGVAVVLEPATEQETGDGVL